MYKGSCLCGAVNYVIRGELGATAFCHCSRCRKASGTAFASNATVQKTDFEFVSGQDVLRVFSTDAGVHRTFCSQCGSPIIAARDTSPTTVRLRLGTLDTPGKHPEMHIFAASKADWYDITDDLPQYEGFPPAPAPAPVPDTSKPPSR